MLTGKVVALSTPHDALDPATLLLALERWWERASAQNSVGQADRLRAHLIVFAVREQLGSAELAAELDQAFSDFELNLNAAPRGRDGVEASRGKLLAGIYAATRQVRGKVGEAGAEPPKSQP